jgi:hypothetical protein
MNPYTDYKELQVLHIHRHSAGATEFTVNVNSLKEAKKVMAILSNYDQLLLSEKLQPDTSTAQFLEVKYEDEWESWEDEDGNDIDSVEID